MDYAEPLLRPLHERNGEPALRIAGGALCYRDLRQAAGAAAAQVGGARRVGVWADSTLETCIAIVGALATGATVVPVNPKLGEAELRHVLGDSAPELLFGAPEDALSVLERRPSLATVDPDARGELPVDELDDEHPALIVYTSGTTGMPKGAVLPRRSVASNLDALAEAWEWTDSDRLTHALPLFHVHGLVLGLLGPLRRGGELHHLGRFEPAALAGALEDGATMVFGVPTMYHRLAEQAGEDQRLAAALARPRLLVSGSAPLPAPDFDRIEELTGQRIVERYGLTETLMNTAVRADGERRPGYVGEPLQGIELRLVGDDGSDIEESDDDTIGEVAVRGPNLFTGYLNRPEATSEAVRDGWFFTGDMAARAPDGYLRIVGRRSTDLIKTGGYKVGAGEIETVLLGHPGVEEAAVVAAPDSDLGERIVAFVVSPEGASSPPAEELIDHVAGQLAPHKRPREVRFVDSLPRNAMGKVMKKELEV
ncbi:MAG: malonyl-CoA/methylmalonyl-CoA synthetase [Thermoleophilaceae bacterium]|jgi:malonyl-CoA/methylmalonyl-CoA synthetase|nr:malonyl-CoA/methylmalonyl-CoA synthetase [Thermoleophilaceae bacterium]